MSKQHSVSINLSPSLEEQEQLVSVCNQIKRHLVQHAAQKKELMRTCFAYSKNRFVGNDLLPTPSALGSERDNNKSRPQVFIPLARQQLKTIFAQLKLTIFPNDQDFFRIRAKTRAGMAQEDLLTEGLKYLFKESQISEKIAANLYNLIWSGCFAALPLMRQETVFEWAYKPPAPDGAGAGETDRFFESRSVGLPPVLDVETFNPINFYVDPFAQDPDASRWVYVGRKKRQEMLDSSLYFNRDQLQALSAGASSSGADGGYLSLNALNDLGELLDRSDDNLRYDLYYFPYLKTEFGEYRNMIVGIAEEQVLVRMHPNLFPKGLNPVVFCSWMHDTDNPYGIGPIEDLIDLQKAVNILWNYKLEVLARSGNRFAVRPNVDLSNFFGVAGGVAVTEDPRGDIVNFSGDYSEIAAVDNSIGVLKAEAQLVAGSQNPFQGSSQVDYQKTATELQILQENSISILREVIEHVSVMGVRRILERLMYLVADMFDSPVEIPVNKPMRGREFEKVDFSRLKSGEFTIDLVSVNPSQSKQVQINGLMQLMELVGNDPESLLLTEPIVEKIGDLVGIKNIRELVEQVKNRYELLKEEKQNGHGRAIAAPPGAGLPVPQEGLGALAQSALGGVSLPGFMGKKPGPV